MSSSLVARTYALAERALLETIASHKRAQRYHQSRVKDAHQELAAIRQDAHAAGIDLTTQSEGENTHG